METKHEFSRDFVTQFVEETRKRAPNAEEHLFSMTGTSLQEFAELLDLPSLLLKQFAATHGDKHAPRQMFHEPPTYALMVRREIVLKILEKVGR